MGLEEEAESGYLRLKLIYQEAREGGEHCRKDTLILRPDLGEGVRRGLEAKR